MLTTSRGIFGHSPSAALWADTAPVRNELFGVERLEQHAESLAAAQTVTATPRSVLSLHARLKDNAAVLFAAYRASGAELEKGRPIVHAAQWLLDNYRLIEEQIREIKDDMPRRYYRQHPKLADGPLAGYPRVFGLAWAFVAHTDSHFDPKILHRFVVAYQRVQPLTICELWALPITLRIVLIENLRRLAEQITSGRRARADAELLADRLLTAGHAQSALDDDMATRATGPLSERFAAELAKRLRDQDPQTMPALGWLDDRLRLQGSSVEDVVQHAQQRQGASNVTVRNIITSMRLICDVDWVELFEGVSLVDVRLRDGSNFAQMDFPTRNLYRSAIEELARGSEYSELDIADRALSAAHRAPMQGGAAVEAERSGDPGYHLIAEGRPAFERTIAYRPTARLWRKRFSIRLGIGGYIGGIVLVTLMLLALALWFVATPGLTPGLLVALALIWLVPASEVVTAVFNSVITSSFGATVLPGLELTAGVPRRLRTLVAVPTLLTSEADLLEQIGRLEVHHLAGTGGDITFALLTDGLDADTQEIEEDAPLLAAAAAAIETLNQRYGPGPDGPLFLLLHRRRLFNPGEGKWMGWERKRGKLHELNRLLRGATNTNFITVAGHAPCVPSAVRFVIALDADTRLPRDAAQRLIGKMAHPLNQPCFDGRLQRVVRGHAVLQPRVTPSLPIGREGSWYQRIFSGPGGIDPYAGAVSDVYQDLFGEGSYTGKGIYDVDAFEASLRCRVPDNTMLSHDLFEGIFARAGLVSDVEVIEEFPARYDVAARRQHRWTRGDWQLLPWALRAGTGRDSMPAVGRWKIVDNLRRSVLAPFTFAGFGLCWLLPGPAAADGTLFLLAAILIPTFLSTLFTAVPRRPGLRLRNHFGRLGGDLNLAAAHSFLSLALLVDQSWRMGDAIGRTTVRMVKTRRHLLEWTTAAQSNARPRLDMRGFYQNMAGSTLLGLVLSAAVLIIAPTLWALVLPFALLWLSAPALARQISRSPAIAPRLLLSAPEARALRRIARRTWRFFETFVTAADNMLPPDNFQEDPNPVLAHRTSPTNIGLYLLSTAAARDFGWAGTTETIERLEATFATLQKLTKFNGHLFNWYATQTLQALDPAYVSSVDSGNLAGHLIALANACEEWKLDIVVPDARSGMADNVCIARDAVRALLQTKDIHDQKLITVLEEIDSHLNGSQPFDTLLPMLQRLADKAAQTVRAIIPVSSDGPLPDAVFWTEALARGVTEHRRDRGARGAVALGLGPRLATLAAAARKMALDMDFAFLLDPERKLLSIGYSLADNSLDANCYDLLASEARLTSFIGVAKGDLPTRHWFRLGRRAIPLGSGSVLISWSGSMFEYLMPSLVMRAPPGSLLEQTYRLVVQRQEAYGKSLGIPWGISESAYNVRDIEFTYQYSNFGVPGLGLKRGLSESSVIAPYATGLAAMVDPRGASQNYVALAGLGATGRFGFYEALDFTRGRHPDGEAFAIVRSFMAHHQGMTIVAIANVLHAGQMRARFHREPMILASELLLQERVPRDVAVAHPQAEDIKSARKETGHEAPTVRHITAQAATGPPVTHLLSNGRYAVMVTACGGGYSRWNDIAITRWQADSTCDIQGSFIYLRDVRSGEIWSTGIQPMGAASEHGEIVFAEDYAQFVRHDGALTTTLDVLVSGEDDGEVRRITLANGGRQAREIELTSYAELVLTDATADMAHPAFAKMFVQTEYLAEYGALIASRRPRDDHEARVWAAHFAVVEGEIVADPQYESDRARFLGRGRTAATAAAIMDAGTLSNTVGTVLDPVFAIRQRAYIAPGKAARIAFWTVVAASREALLDLIDKHHDRNAYDRARTLAWTQAHVQLHHLGIAAGEAAEFQTLAAPLLYADPRFRAPSQTIIRGAGMQSELWPLGISGDLPIVLLRVDDIADIAQVPQLLRAHEYWHMKCVAVDLVIVNEHTSSYLQDLQIAIEAAVRRSQSRPRFGAPSAQGLVHTLRAEMMSAETRALLRSCARVALIARLGPISDQMARLPRAPARRPRRRTFAAGVVTPVSTATMELEYFNGFGGFNNDATEYVTILDDGRTTPAPWINVIANPAFGFQVSADGSGYSWQGNSRENQLTPWSNDPVADPSGEAFYFRDEDTGELWSPTAQPIRGDGRYVAYHGFGYTRFAHEANGIASELLQYVALADPIKISRLTLRNTSGRSRRLRVTSYVEWVLGKFRSASAPFIITQIDSKTGALLARNPWSIGFSGCVGFADLGGQQSTWTADRSEFLGFGGDMAAPAALTGKNALSGKTGAGLDPCAALQTMVEIGAGESVKIFSFLGQCASEIEAAALVRRYRDADLDAVLTEVTDYWHGVLGAVQVETPDRTMNIMLNGWLLYQTLACRIWARSAFYQASGAYGFRDQLQDGMALTFARPEETRRHLLRAAGRQFEQGDVQHWWLPHSGQGVRTRICDDRAWLAFAAATYVATSGDTAVLDEPLPFLEGRPLHPGEHDAFFQPAISDHSASLFAHCALGLDQYLHQIGEHGLPLIGTGDWNDGMNRVGEGGKGESVWLGWFLLRTIALFAPLAQTRDPVRAERWRRHAQALRTALEAGAWDGAWYRRASFDDGTWLGGRDNDECRIDSIAQSWAVLSGEADPARAALAMDALDTQLIRRDDKLALLFTPPFDKTLHDPGYIKGYPPGLRENGGQYSHAAMWAVHGFAVQGNGDKAWALFSLLNPINHAHTFDDVERYKVEPYVVAADVYSVAPHVGRGGWTWYTGAAGWMYRAGIEAILGIRREGRFLVLAPCLPAGWPGFKATVTAEEGRVDIVVKNLTGRGRGISGATLDGLPQDCTGGAVRIPMDASTHRLLLSM
ncbi:MAG: glycosyl transferase [Alphaproteobacteria bacterium]|nr:glycosyl transferase [Alphaproteobacteria bacterium]